MSNINPYSSSDTDSSTGDSNVFLDLNKPDEATGVPSVISGSSGSGSDAGFSSGTPEPSKFNGQVILAGLVFVIGVGAIYAMRYVGMQAGINEKLSTVEYTASTNTPDFIARFDRVMDNLEDVSVSIQFEQNTKLPNAPFTMGGVTAAPIDFNQPVARGESEADRKARLAREKAEQERAAQEAKDAEIESVAYGLTLQSVMGGTRPVVRISGKPYTVGMKIQGVLTILSVEGSTVILGSGQMKFKLVLGSTAERIDK